MAAIRLLDIRRSHCPRQAYLCTSFWRFSWKRSILSWVLVVEESGWGHESSPRGMFTSAPLFRSIGWIVERGGNVLYGAKLCSCSCKVVETSASSRSTVKLLWKMGGNGGGWSRAKVRRDTRRCCRGMSRNVWRCKSLWYIIFHVVTPSFHCFFLFISHLHYLTFLISLRHLLFILFT